MAHVDCSEGSVNKKMCDQQDVTLYPTVFFYTPGTSAVPGTKLWPSDTQNEMASPSFALSVIQSIFKEKSQLVKLLSADQPEAESADADRRDTGATACCYGIRSL